MDNATVKIISMRKIAVHARRIFTTILNAKAVIVTQQVLLLNLLDVDLFQLVNYVNVKSELKGEFVINADLFIGI